MEQKQMLLLQKDQIEFAINEMVNKVVKKVKYQPVTDWLTEEEVGKLLGYSDMQYMRKIARNNNIKMSKRGRLYYYSLESINRYLEEGVVREI